MKKLFVIALFAISGFIYSGEAKTPQYGDFEIGFFYSSLSPYGKWIQIDAGLVVWRPTIIKRGWAPYKHGRWIWTVDGWYWDSYEPFGHIVFHYGRWYYDDYYGWIWIPDYEWAPAWVEWRYDDDYIGWAPLTPYATFSIHIGIHYTHSYYVPYAHWHFVKYRYFCDPYVYNHYLGPKYKYRVYSKSKHRVNYIYRDGRVKHHGVDINFVKQRTGQDIKVRDIIRTSDYREVEKFRGKDTEKIRTFVASRDQLSRTNVKDVRIEKSDKRSSLESSRISLGNRNETNKTEIQRKDNRETPSGRSERDVNIKKEKTKRSEVKVNERTGNNKRNDISVDRKKQESVETKRTERNNSGIRQDVKKNESTRIEKKNDTRLKQERNTNRNEVKIERNTNPPANRQTEIKRNDSRERNNVKIERKDTQKKEVKVERKTDSQVKKQTEVKRNDSRSNQNKTKVKRDSGNQNSKERKR